MAKNTSQSQGSFSFFDDPEQKEPVPQPRAHVLRPPAQIELVEEEEASPENEANKNAADVGPADVDIHEPPAGPVPTEEVAGGSMTATPGQEEETAEVLSEEDNTDPLQERRSSRGRKSVKDNSLAAEMIEMPADDVLYAKQYYSMGEVTAMFKENHSLIRYWESEFDILRPKKNGKGDRFFRPVDVKNLYLIYDLLRRRKFTIEGARDYLKNNRKADEKFAAVQALEKIKSFFMELKAGL